MQMKLPALIVGVGLLATQAPMQAHHSFAAEYDGKAEVKLQGTVVKMEWINPHSWIHIDVKRPDGQVERWRVEAGGPSGLIRRGWTKESIPPGIQVHIFGYRARDNSLQAAARTLTLPDGRALFAGSEGTGAPGDLTAK